MGTLTVQRIAESFGWSTLAKARPLCKNGSVLDWGFDISRLKLLGKVRESDRQKPYQVEVHLHRSEDTGELSLTGHCTCSLKRDCAHSAAVALSAAEDLEKNGGTDFEALNEGDEAPVVPSKYEGKFSRYMANWLQSLESSFTDTSGRQLAHDCVLYILGAHQQFNKQNL
jgi:hypothetical protein